MDLVLCLQGPLGCAARVKALKSKAESAKCKVQGPQRKGPLWRVVAGRACGRSRAGPSKGRHLRVEKMEQAALMSRQAWCLVPGVRKSSVLWLGGVPWQRVGLTGMGA